MYRKIQIFKIHSHLAQNINTFCDSQFTIHTHSFSFSLSNRRQSSKRVFSLLQITSPRERSVCYSNPKICPRETCHLHQYFPTNAYFRTCLFSFLFFFFRSKRKRDRERKIYIYIYILATKCTREKVCLFLMRARVALVTGTRDVPDGIGECSGATSSAMKTMKERRKWNLISSRANTFGAVCYVTSLRRRTGWPF